MNVIELKKIKDCKHFIGGKPSKQDYNVLIKRPTIFKLNGRVVAIYDKLPSEKIKYAEKVARTTKTQKSFRQHSGVPTVSSVFGSVPKNGIRRSKCMPASRNKKEKSNFFRITKLAELLANEYEKHMPAQYKKDAQVVYDLVEKDYLFKGLPFSTFNANVNQLIKYHTDSGNFKGVMSNVLISRYGVSGGELVFPEYGFALAQENGFYSVFDGQKEIHGVAECKFVSKDAYRCSFVFYTLEQMKNCDLYRYEIEKEKRLLTKKNVNRSKTFGMTPKEFSKFQQKESQKKS